MAGKITRDGGRVVTSQEATLTQTPKATEPREKHLPPTISEYWIFDFRKRWTTRNAHRARSLKR